MPNLPSIPKPVPGLSFGRLIDLHGERVGRIVWSPDGSRVASSSTSEIVIWDAVTNESLSRLTFQESSTIWDIAWSGDARLLAVAHGREISILEPIGVLVARLTGHTARVYSLAWSPDGRFLASGSGDNTIRIWDLESWQTGQVLTTHTRPVYAVAWSPSGQELASASKDRVLGLWDTSAWELRARLQGHTSWVVSLAWSRDGSRLVSSSLDSTIRIWDARRACLVATLEGHTSGVYWIALSANDDLLASKSGDHTIRLWDGRDWRQLGVLDQPESDYGYYWPAGPAFHPRLMQMAALHGVDRTIGLWEADANALRSSKETRVVHYASANVVLLGDVGAGRSSLAVCLAGDSFELSESTRERSIRTLYTEEVPVGAGAAEIREVLLWDMDGQPGYRLLAQTSLAQVDVAVIVFDSQLSGVESIRAWIRSLYQARRARSAPGPLSILLVSSRVDRSQPLLPARLRELASEFNIGGWFSTSAKTGQGIAELRNAIKKAIDWSSLPTTTSTELLHRIRAFLLREKESGRQVSTVDQLFRAFRADAPDAGLNREALRAEFDTAILLLSSSGLITSLSFAGLVLLKPELLDRYAAGILAAACEGAEGLGTVAVADILAGHLPVPVELRVQDRELERMLLVSTMEELLRQEVAIREGSGETAYLIFPTEVRRERPDDPETSRGSIIYRFDGPVARIYASLAVRLQFSDTFRRTAIWRNRVEYSSPGGGHCAIEAREEHDDRGEIRLVFTHISAEDRTLLDRFVRGHLERHATAIERARILICPTCGTEIGERQVAQRLVRGFTFLSCPVCETVINLEEESDEANKVVASQAEWLAELGREESEAAAILHGKLATNDFDVYISHNAQDLPAVREIAARLRQRGLLPWILEDQRVPGEKWKLAMADQATRAKAVAVFYGKNGIGPNQAVEIEMLVAEVQKRRIPLIPVLLSDVVDTSGMPDSVQEFTWVDFRRTEPDPIELLVYGIWGGHGSVRSGEAAGMHGEPARKVQIEDSLAAAETRGDWAASRQFLVELAQLALEAGEADVAVSSAQRALRMADDPMKLDGKGLREPIELLASLRPKLLDPWLIACSHRDLGLREVRELHTADRPEIASILKNAGIALWLEWFGNPSVVTPRRGGQGWPSARVRHLRLRNIKSFQDLACSFLDSSGSPRPISTFVGDNATGKSRILQALALTCLGSSFCNRIEGIGAQTFLRNGASFGAIEVEIELAVDPDATPAERGILHLGLGMDGTRKDFFPLPDGEMTLGAVNHMAGWDLLRGQVGLEWGYCGGYGAFRALRERRDKLGASTQVPVEIDRVLSLFQPQDTLLDPAVLDSLFQADVSALSQETKQIPLGVRDSIVQLFRNNVPGIGVQEVGGRVQLVEEHSGVSSPSALSDGCNSMIGLLGHVIRHALELQGWTRDPAQAEGIVLIDEVDLHLHPSWQRTALPQLEQAFPKLQLIVTTHSPLVLGGVPDGIVSVLSRDEDGRTVMTTGPSVKGWRVDQLLNGMHFDMTKLYDVDTENLRKEYGRQLNEFGPAHPVVQELEKRLDEQMRRPHESTVPDLDMWKLLDEFADFRFAKLSDEQREAAVARMWELLRR
jgi:GTPase SAR1 family protein